MRRMPDHLPEYAIEAVLLAAFMVSACAFGVVLEHPDSVVHRVLPDPTLRRVLMGLVMGATAVSIIYSPWGGRSGAHINPATTLSFFLLGRIRGPDVLGYVLAQFLGAVAGVALASAALGRLLAHPSVNYVVTQPGQWGQGAALLGELLISGLLMGAVVMLTGSRVARFTGLTVGLLVALYITFEAPLSGMSMNPARSFGSAWASGTWRAFWLYVVGPLGGMALGAWVARRFQGRDACPKLNHPLSQRCIFCGHEPASPSGEPAGSEMSAGTRVFSAARFMPTGVPALTVSSPPEGHLAAEERGGVQRAGGAQRSRAASMRTWDAMVVGSGQSGVPFAVALARAGRRTALVERADVGGTCVNVGCTPTKTLVASARVAATVARAAEYGIEVGPSRARWAAVRDREQGVVSRFRAVGEQRLRDAGVTLLRGEARFVGPRRLLVTGKDGEAEEHDAAIVVINTGARPRRPELPGLESVPALDSSSILTLPRFPERLLVRGGGDVSLELGQVFRRLGAEVTVVETAARLAAREDEEISRALSDLLRAEGLSLHLGVRPVQVGTGGAGVRLELEGRAVLEGTHLLLGVGRVPNTEALDCAAGGIALDHQGFIRVDDRLRTTAQGVYATGDVTGAPQFTHVSYDDYRVLRAHLLEGPARSPVGRLIPYTLFTDPQLGRVGLTEAEARDRGLPIKVAQLPMTQVARAIESGETRGLLRAVVHAETDRILGFSALCFEGGELASLVHTAMLGDLPWTVLRDTIYPHPGLAESLNNLFDAWI